MATPTGVTTNEIKNLALFELGFVEEIDFTDLTNATVKKVNRTYDSTLLSVLSNYPWRFAIKRAALTGKATADDTYKHIYTYDTPTNMLVVKGLFYDANYSSPIREFETTPTKINMDATAGYIAYIDIVAETTFPQYFVNYFKYKLAMDLCFNLTGDTELLKLLAIQEQKMLLNSKNIDAKQNPTRTIKSSPFTAIRG